MSADLGFYVRHRDDGTAAINLVVENITCAACIFDIEKALRKLPGLIEARVNYTNRRLGVSWNEGQLDPSQVLTELTRLGYNAHPFQVSTLEAEEARQTAWLLRCLAVAGFAAMNIMLLSISIWSGNISDITPETRDLFHAISALIALPAAAYAGQPFFRSALRALRARSLNMDVPISIGVIGALGMSVAETFAKAERAYFDSAIMLLFFLLAGRVLDHITRQKTRSIAGNLAALAAQTACKVESSGDDSENTIEIPVCALKPGDTVLIRPGSSIAVDGAILEGSSEVDQSLITGETAHQKKAAGDMVYAGTMNLTGALRLRVVAAGEGTLLEEIQRLVEAAMTAKSRYVRIADKVAKLYAPVVHLTALLTALAWLCAGSSLHDAIIVAISVLIITCPCALALAVPAVQVVASSWLFRCGILLNTGDALERLANIDTVLFDKTGTLTLPEPKVVNAASLPSELLTAAAQFAAASHHPLARAVSCKSGPGAGITGLIEMAGAGVSGLYAGQEGRLGSPHFCGLEAQAEAMGNADPEASMIAFRLGEQGAILQVRQEIRTGAVQTVLALKDQNLKLAILSGDRKEAVKAAAETLQIADWQAGLKPAAKVKIIEDYKSRGHKVLMVGDGLNDAPALASAHVSISPITASDFTQASADMVFLGDRLQPVLDAIVTAKKARCLMRQNLALALIYNAVAVPLAMAGFITPLIAALAMSSSSLLVTLNALRARPYPRRATAADAAPESISPIPLTVQAAA